MFVNRDKAVVECSKANQHYFEFQNRTSFLYILFYMIVKGIMASFLAYFIYLELYYSILSLLIYLPLIYLLYMSLFSIVNRNFTEKIYITKENVKIKYDFCGVLTFKTRTLALATIKESYSKEVNELSFDRVFENRKTQNSAQHSFQGIDKQNRVVKFGYNISESLQERVRKSLAVFKVVKTS